METNREAHQAKMKAQLDEWSAKLDVLKAKAAKAEADAKIELYKAMDEMHELQASAKQHLDQLASASADRWTSPGTGWYAVRLSSATRFHLGAAAGLH